MRHFFIAILLLLVCCSQAQSDLQKIIYRTTGCLGSCRAYSLEIDTNKSVKLVVVKVYKKGSAEADSTRMGNFTGKLTGDQYQRLLDEVKAAGIEHLQFPDVFCCDAPIVTLIVYNNKGRNYFKSMTPPQQARSLLNYLFSLCENNTFKKTTEKLTIEQ